MAVQDSPRGSKLSLLKDLFSHLGTPHVLHRYRHYLPIQLKEAREPWIRFSVLGEEWLPPPRGWDEILRRDERSILRRVHRPDLGWVIELEARLSGESTLVVDSKIRRGRTLSTTVEQVESLGEDNVTTYVDGLLVAQPRTVAGRLLWSGRTGPLFSHDLEAEWDHRRHCMCQVTPHCLR